VKLRVYIDRISVDGFAWSARERRAFERSFGPALREAIAREAGVVTLTVAGRRAAFETLAVPTLDADNTGHAETALASSLAKHVLAVPGELNAGTAKAGAR
jgi:hypothetical protein